MGNSESCDYYEKCLEPYRYYFDNPKVGDFDLSNVRVYIIKDKKSADAAETFLNYAKVLYVDCEGDKFGSAGQALGTIQVATSSNCCLLFHVAKCRHSLGFLKTLFESDEVQKVFHDCSGDSAILYQEKKIQLSKNNTDDTQIAHKVIISRSRRQPINTNTGPSLKDLYEFYCEKKIPGNKHFNKKTRSIPGENVWTHNPELFDAMVKYAVVDVLAVHEIFAVQERMFTKDSQYRNLVSKQIDIKIRNFEQEVSTLEGFSWGKVLAIGAAATAVTLLASSAVSEDCGKSKKKKENNEENKECVIS